MGTYTPNLGLYNPTPNVDSNNTWGTDENNGRSLIDQAVTGYLSLSVAGSANVVLSVTNGVADQERNWHFNFTGALTGNIFVLYPQGRMKQFSVTNNTTGAFTLGVGVNNGAGAPAGATVNIPQGAASVCGSDGTNCYLRANFIGLGFTTTGTGAIVLATNPTLTNNLTVTGQITENSGLNVGYLEVPRSGAIKTANYAVVAGDSGQHILMNGTSLTVTIPSNGGVSFNIGTVLTFININSSALSIAITTDTMTLVNSTTTGTRTLAQNGIATAIKTSATGWIISGAGLT